jgi:hypothetical protein
MKKEIFFVDFENIQNLHFKKKDGVQSSIILFVGSKQSSLNIDTLINLMSAFEFKIIKVEATTKNALDFSLSIEIGVNHQKEDLSVKFIIVSKDRDFEAVSSYMKNSGREIELQSNIAKTVVPVEKREPLITNKHLQEDKVAIFGKKVIEKFSLKNFSKAGKISTLENQILSMFKGDNLTKNELSKVIDYLQNVKFLRIEANNIIYKS